MCFSRTSKGAEHQRSFSRSSESKPQGKGAPFSGGAETPQPLFDCPQHRAAEADGGRGLPLLPAARCQAETAPAAAAAEAGTPRQSQQPGGAGGALHLSCASVLSSCGQTQAQEHQGVFQSAAISGVRPHRESLGPRGAHGHAGPGPLPPPPQAQSALQAHRGTKTASDGAGE